MPERLGLERELSDLGVSEHFFGRIFKPATIGFEFDVNYGFLEEVVVNAGKTMPNNDTKVTTHSEASEGFKVKLDGDRMEIGTKVFKVNSSGKAELTKTVSEIGKFAAELYEACKKAAPADIPIPNVAGKPRPFTHPKTDPAGLPIVRLPQKGRFHPQWCMVWASPQATITTKLIHIGALVNAIKRSEGKGAGRALTGDNDKQTWRMGVRSVALYDAHRGVEQLYRQLIGRKPILKLSDGTPVDDKSFTSDLKGFLTLLAMYVRTSELRYDFSGRPGSDYERYAKAYLPINVKAPFSEIFQSLSTKERLMFKELFTGDARHRLFALGKRGATNADGSRKLFPAGPMEGSEGSVYVSQKSGFSGHVPTWDDFVQHTLDSSHKSWGHRLMVPSHTSSPKMLGESSKIIPMSITKPFVALELRRIGFKEVFARDWPGLMSQVFDMNNAIEPFSSFGI
jgi:hypothetical protein